MPMLLCDGMLVDHNMCALLKFEYRELLALAVLTMRDHGWLGDVAKLFRFQMVFVVVIRHSKPRCKVLTLVYRRMLVITCSIKIRDRAIVDRIGMGIKFFDFSLIAPGNGGFRSAATGGFGEVQEGAVDPDRDGIVNDGRGPIWLRLLSRLGHVLCRLRYVCRYFLSLLFKCFSYLTRNETADGVANLPRSDTGDVGHNDSEGGLLTRGR